LEVSRVVETMHQISDSSTKVAEIISVIEGIAFQTNILALNAAVEVARAGEQGRGCAVVVGEVRTLAQRSAAAAKEIKALISESVHRVEAGSKLVDYAGRTINEIVESVRRVTGIMNEISSASQESSTGIEQANQAVSQMDQVTQQNAALVEEASAVAHSMAEQAQELRDAVAVFKVRRYRYRSLRVSSGYSAKQASPARAEDPFYCPPPRQVVQCNDNTSCRRRRHHRRSVGFNQCRLANVLTKLLGATLPRLTAGHCIAHG
jgi:hypothetical protein